MCNPEPRLENEIHKLFWDFEIQTDYQNSARRRDKMKINKKKKKNEKEKKKTEPTE